MSPPDQRLALHYIIHQVYLYVSTRPETGTPLHNTPSLSLCLHQTRDWQGQALFSGCQFREKGMKRTTLGSRGQSHTGNRSPKFLSVRFHKNHSTNFNQTWQAHIMVTITHVQKANCNTRLNDRFGGMAQASFSTPLGRAAFLVSMWYNNRLQQRLTKREQEMQ